MNTSFNQDCSWLGNGLRKNNEKEHGSALAGKDEETSAKGK